MAKPKEIQICTEHPEYKTPLVWTIAFDFYNPYWCPYCGLNGTENSGITVPASKELLERHETYRKYAEDYMRAQAYIGKSMGLTLKFKEKEKLQKAKDDWKYGQKIDDLLSKT